MMSEDLTRQLLALPLPERVELAQALWQSIDDRADDDSTIPSEDDAIAIALRRDAELTSGQLVGRIHEQIIEVIRSELLST